MGFGASVASSIANSAGAIATSALGAGASIYGQHSANQANEHMYRNRYQMTMADMRAAGLNPIFAYQQGAGSAPPAMQSVFSGAADAFGKTAQSAIALKKAEQELLLLEKQTINQNEQSNAAHSQTGVNQMAERLQKRLGDKMFWESQSARIEYDTNRIVKQMIERDSQYELDNPALMKTRKWGSAFGLLPSIPSGHSALGWKKLLTKGK